MSEKTKIVILGAGVGGLSAGYFLSKNSMYDITILEKKSVIGGLCGSFKHDGFILDYGPHKLYSVIPGIMDEITKLMGDKILKIEKKNRLCLMGQFLDYPLRMGNLAGTLGLVMFFKIGFGYALELIKNIFNKNEASSYEEYIIRRFGRPAYELVFEPLADKVWGSPSTLHPEMARRRLPASGGLELILKLLKIKKETKDTNADFFYYPVSGFNEFCVSLQKQIESKNGKVVLNTSITGIKREKGKIKSIDCIVSGESKTFPCDILISSIQIEDLGKNIFSDSEKGFYKAVNSLQFRHLILVYIFVKRQQVLNDHWIFFPEKKYIFSRISEQKLINKDLGPEYKTCICCDFTCGEESKLWQTSDEEIAEESIKGLVDTGLIKRDEVYEHTVIRMKKIYPRYDKDYENNFSTVLNKFKEIDNLILTGRIGMYNYNNADHCLDMGRFISERINKNIPTAKIIDELEKQVEDYKIVD